MDKLKMFGKALITGASSGIGKQYAKKLAEMKNDLVLVARRREKLTTLRQELEKKYSVKVEVIAADLSTDDGIRLVEDYINQNKDISILINNAGFAIPEYFSESNIDKQLSMIYVHNIAVVRLIRAALTYMKQKNKGVIINTSSAMAFMPMERNSIYCASKSFINVFSDSLKRELNGTAIIVQSLNPGLTHSGFHSTDVFKKLKKPQYPAYLWMDTEEVVSSSFKNLGNKVIHIPGFKNQILVKVYKILKKNRRIKSRSVIS